MLPSILILDDPTTDLDPVSKQEVMDILMELKEEIDTTFIIIEHDLNDLIEAVDRVIIMHEGSILYNGSPSEIFYTYFDELNKLGIRIPDHIRLAKYLIENGNQCDFYPISKKEAYEWAKKLLVSGKLNLPKHKVEINDMNEETVAKLEAVNFSYQKGKQILYDINLEVQKGEFLAIVGHNGCGKSTLMKNLIGLLKPHQGSVIINHKNTKEHRVQDIILDIGYVFQNPDNQLFCNSVEEEVAFGLINRGYSKELVEEQVELAISTVGLQKKEKIIRFRLAGVKDSGWLLPRCLYRTPK
ncbi:ATP-binding cassette domain-containing protein [Cytobacillus pseudoceanisediminis]|nr:ABC transporter ATP-binding protein [Cytobacillus pseudoceanisediminis]UQX55066.1 ATP-binding cassette domain-containing protein [Cytobacillus pseudoceanisediminis]